MVTELFTTGRKVSIRLVFITQYYFAIPKHIYQLLQTILLRKFQKSRASTNCI